MPEPIQIVQPEEPAEPDTAPLHKRLREMARSIDRSSYSFDKPACADLMHEAADALFVQTVRP